MRIRFTPCSENKTLTASYPSGKVACEEDTGKKSGKFDRRVIQEGDKYLITYGNESDEELESQIASVPDVISTIRPGLLPQPISL